MFTEPSQYFKRKNRKPNRPLRTIKEMADEFGVTYQSLASWIYYKNGPSPRYKTGSPRLTHNTWYDPVELRKWWKDLEK